MAQPKGSTGNPKGRPKGSPNKTTTEMRDMITKFVGDNLEKIQEDFDKLDPAKRIEMLDKMMKYVLPNRVAVELDKPDTEERIVINIGDKEINLKK